MEMIEVKNVLSHSIEKTTFERKRNSNQFTSLNPHSLFLRQFWFLVLKKIRKLLYVIPVDTRRRFNVYKTSIRRRRRRIDVETTSCVYWDIAKLVFINFSKFGKLSNNVCYFTGVFFGNQIGCPNVKNYLSG